MNLVRGHRIALDPTDAQVRYFVKASGCDRFCWNLAVDEWDRRYRESSKKPNWIEIVKDFNEIKYFAFPWMKKIHRDAHSWAFRRLNSAWNTHFKNPESFGRPRFRKKNKKKDIFYISNDRIKIVDKIVKLPVIGWVRMREVPRFSGKVLSAVVSRTADRWYITIETNIIRAEINKSGDGVIGVDLGINHAVVLSTGEKIDGPKPLEGSRRQIKRLLRKCSRQSIGGHNYKNTRSKLARIHARIANIRKDFLHKITTRLCRENQAIAIEDLNVKGMMQNKDITMQLIDASFGTFFRLIVQKSESYGNEVTVVNRFYPSSKTCSRCGLKKDKFLRKERLFKCDSCGAVIDRDVNAAINLRNQIPTACGKSMSADWERLVKAPREAETFKPVCSGTCTQKTRSKRADTALRGQ